MFLYNRVFRFGWFINIKSKFVQRKKCERFMFHIKNYNSDFNFNSRLEATEAAIKKTNELLNLNILKKIELINYKNVN